MGTILVVDDSLPVRYSTARILTAAGFDVREAATGRDALRLASVADLIVLDIALPDIDGFEVCARLKEDRLTRHTPIVCKTAAYLDSDDRHRGLALGADDYLTEPVDPVLLVQCVQRLLVPAPERAREARAALTATPVSERAERTQDKTRRGGLPAPLPARPSMGRGNGEPCSGCGDPKARSAIQYDVTWAGVVTFSFHEECYRAWSTFPAR
jgi:CheY-like chemotaxis protein